MSISTDFDEARFYLTSRGVLETTAAEHHVELIENPSLGKIKNLLHFAPDPLPKAVLVFPNYYASDNGNIVIGQALRCFPASTFDGKERKFLWPRGAHYRPYILPEVRLVASQLETPIYIVEKQAAALMLLQLGLSAIALGGTWGAGQPQTEEEKQARAKRVLHADLAAFSWIGRDVYLCFDSDFSRREGVLQGLLRTFVLLFNAGANVKVLQWDPEFKGLDDYVACEAGLDLEKQRQVIAELTDPLRGMEVKEAATQWIKPTYLPLIEREGSVIAMSPSAQNKVAHLFAKLTGVSVGSLESTWGDKTKELSSSGIVGVYEPWDAPVNGLEVAEDIFGVIRKFSYVRDEETCALTCWVFLCALMDHVTILPIAAITSPVKRCGKTNLLGVLKRLCRKALMASGLSPASVYRAGDLLKPTLLADELDTYLPDNHELRGLFNSGHTIDGAYKILVNPDTMEVEKFSTFFPKAMG
jgi:hypothetical protein